MQLRSRFGFAALLTFAAAGCGNSSSFDAGDVVTPVDTTADVSEAATDAGNDVATDAPMVSPAGNRCINDSQCGRGFMCLLQFVEGGLCSHTCTERTSQTQEQMECGGSGATCLSAGDNATASSYCEHACSPQHTPTGCRPGFVCTGWWYTHMTAMPDSPGCWTFCSADADCPSGSVCNTRYGQCGTAHFDPTLRPDGQPCTPMAGGTGTECRGVCFRSAVDNTRGICGSLLNTQVATMCPDDPANVLPHGVAMDDVALCIWRSCNCDADCTAPLVCVPAGTTGMSLCDYPSAMAPGTPCTDAGVTDAGDAASDAPHDASTDAASDAASTG